MTDERCEDCGERMFFNHHLASGQNGVWRHTHGNCESAATVLERLPVIYDLAIQALVEIDELLGRFICQSCDEEYADVGKLQAAIHNAYALSSEGIRSEGRDRESQTVVGEQPQ